MSARAVRTAQALEWARDWQTGAFRASVVVVADGFDPTRLDGEYVIAPRKRAGQR